MAMTVDVEGAEVVVARLQDASLNGRWLSQGRWYNVTANGQSIGAIDCTIDECFAFAPQMIGQGLGRVVPNLWSGVKLLVDERWPNPS